jgi:hypothetical protein
MSLATHHKRAALGFRVEIGQICKPTRHMVVVLILVANGWLLFEPADPETGRRLATSSHATSNGVVWSWPIGLAAAALPLFVPVRQLSPISSAFALGG